MSDEQIRKLLSDVIAEVDYDQWKDYFVADYAEDPEEIERSLKRLTAIVRKHVQVER